MIQILIVDDEPSMREGLSDNLIFEGYKTELAADGTEALEKIDNHTFDLVVLDLMMPGLSGFDVCKQIRQAGNKVPIILLTAKGEEIDKVLGLELGADDYITKPFSLRELIARIKAILRRAENNQTEKSGFKFDTIGLMQVDFKNYTAKIAGKEENLSHREFEVLQYLWTHKQKVVSRDDLLKHIWGYDEFPTTRTIDNFILKLRQRLEINPNDPKIIITVHGIVYKML